MLKKLYPHVICCILILLMQIQFNSGKRVHESLVSKVLSSKIREAFKSGDHVILQGYTVNILFNAA